MTSTFWAEAATRSAAATTSALLLVTESGAGRSEVGFWRGLVGLGVVAAGVCLFG